MKNDPGLGGAHSVPQTQVAFIYLLSDHHKGESPVSEESGRLEDVPASLLRITKGTQRLHGIWDFHRSGFESSSDPGVWP